MMKEDLNEKIKKIMLTIPSHLIGHWELCYGRMGPGEALRRSLSTQG